MLFSYKRINKIDSENEVDILKCNILNNGVIRYQTNKKSEKSFCVEIEHKKAKIKSCVIWQLKTAKNILKNHLVL